MTEESNSGASRLAPRQPRATNSAELRPAPSSLSSMSSLSSSILKYGISFPRNLRSSQASDSSRNKFTFSNGFVEPFLQEPTLLVAQSIIQHFVMIACRQLQILHFTDAVPPVLTCNYTVTPVFTTPLQNEEHVSSPMPVVDPFWLDLGGWRRVLYPVWRLQAHLYSRALHLAFTPISSRPPQLWSG